MRISDWSSYVCSSDLGLHFETCYYQGIEYCLREGLPTFEPGAQGVNKIARGFMPTPVRSRLWIAVPTFASALREWCAEESAEIYTNAMMLEIVRRTSRERVCQYV